MRLNLDLGLWFTGSAAEVVVILLMIYRGIWRRFPVFFAYSIWILVANAAVYVFFKHDSAGYARAYLIDMGVDLLLLFCVLVEIGWSILRPLHGSLWRGSILVVGAVILILGAMIWPFARIPAASSASVTTLFILHLQQTFYVLRILVFLALAGASHFLSIGWRDRELQIATGLGATSLVSLAVAMLMVYPSMRPEFHLLNELVIVTFVSSELYWVFCFVQKEQERRQLTPQIENALLAVAGTARSTRIALSQPRSGGPETGSKP